MTAGPTKAGSAQWKPRSAEELHNLTLLAQAAAGFDSARGDLITVQNMSFNENLSPAAQSLPLQVLSAVRRSPDMVKYVSLLLGTLLLLLLGIRPAMRQISAGFKQAGVRNEQALELEGRQQLLQAAQLDPARLRAQEVFDKVTGQIRNEPTQSSRLLQSWIHSD